MTVEIQTPIAVVGISCRLPGDCNSPEQFWKFLLDGKIASLTPPLSRFSLKGHYDGTLRPGTMRSPGGMFINADPRDLDAGFFGLSQVDATSMDPQQRQLLEVVYEGLENAGLTMEGIKSKSFGCFVGSYASDYSDVQTRDPEDRVPSFTVGCGRAMLSNRISHFLDIKGPSMTIDTACSGSLISVDLACRYLNSGDAEGAVVAGCNLYLSPEHNMDQSAMTSAASPTGRCWTFDARADGYIKAEAINCLILKRLDDAIRDGDPIRAVIRGTSTNSDGWTPGIASPNAEAQALAIRRAYDRAGITNLNDTAYLECHGTGTLAGDPIECRAASSVFSNSRPDSDNQESHLRIGSVKSNIGHSEPAAGISGILKTVLAVERGVIPGNPTFELPNPTIDFSANKILPSKAAARWPQGALRRASVNSFGYGGSNAHAILENPASVLRTYEATYLSSYNTDATSSQNCIDLLSNQEEESGRDITPRLLLFSANDEVSLRAYVKECIRHLADPAVTITPADLEYTLSQRRSRHFFRAYAVTEGGVRFKESQVSYGKLGESPRIGLVFTGQGAQWPQMGRQLLDEFPAAQSAVRRLDDALQSMSEPPSWNLLNELCELRTAEHMRLPTFSQPLVTALQIALLAVLGDWGVKPEMVVGHSSGEIAAAVAAGLLTPEDGIKVAYLRGKAAEDITAAQATYSSSHSQTGTDQGQGIESDLKFGMLAVGLGSESLQKYLDSFPRLHIACRNSPRSVTVSGPCLDLERLRDTIKADGHFARLLMVDLAYHSQYMKEIADHYQILLKLHCPNLALPMDLGPASASNHGGVTFFSTVTGDLRNAATDIEYWIANMVSTVQFDQGMKSLIRSQGGNPTHLVELGPSGALAGPVKQILHSLDQGMASSVEYSSASARDVKKSTQPLYELVGKLFFSGINVNLRGGGSNGQPRPRVIVDLPNYQWNHTVKYWHESLASKDWRHRPFPSHDLLGSKIIGTSWSTPTFKRTLRLKDVPWIRDHTLGTDVVFPASGYIAMAVEAMYQTARCTGMEWLISVNSVAEACYRLRDVRLLRALVIEEDGENHMYLTLNPAQGQGDAWFSFKISTLKDDAWREHCSGLVRVSDPLSNPEQETAQETIEPLRYPCPAKTWYKSMYKVGFHFGPTFQNLIEVESRAGKQTNRATVQFPDYTKTRAKESQYIIHPSVFDSFFQAGIPALYAGHQTLIDQALVPRLIDEIVINNTAGAMAEMPRQGVAESNSVFVTGRRDKTQNYKSNVMIYNQDSRAIVSEIRGLHYTELDMPTSQVKDASRAQTFMSMVWKPDISLIDGQKADLNSLAMSDHHDNVHDETEMLSNGLDLPPVAAFLVSLMKHKVARPSVVDLDMSHTTSKEEKQMLSGPSTILEDQSTAEESEVPQLANFLSSFRRYCYVTSAPEHLAGPQKILRDLPGTEFHVQDLVAAPQEDDIPDKNGFPFDIANGFDLVLLRMPRVASNGDEGKSLSCALTAASKLCARDTSILVLVQQQSLVDSSGSDSDMGQGAEGLEPGVKMSWAFKDTDTVLQSSGFAIHAKSTSNSEDIAARGNSIFSTVYLCSPLHQSGPRQAPVLEQSFKVPRREYDGFSIIDLSKGASHESLALIRSLIDLGWTGSVLQASEVAQLPENVPIMLIDSPKEPLLGRITGSDWDHLVTLMKPGRRLLWITSGSQMQPVMSPSNALVHGFARTLRGEEPTLVFKVLDLSTFTGKHAAWSALKVMDTLHLDPHHRAENEYSERKGALHISRIVVDDECIVSARKSKTGGGEIVQTRLKENPKTVKLWCERLGAIGSIHFNEIPDGIEPWELGSGEVEVEIQAAGVNFKDVVVSLGIVPENEHLLGHEGAGIITRIGAEVTSSRVGDRVVVHTKGAFGNRCRVPKENVFLLPDWLSFEEGATMSVVFFTAVYSLMEIGQIQRGQSILIHSAAGGVGLASIQICRFLGAEVFATVGNAEKRRFLAEECGIPLERIFSSRTVDFAAGIRRLTGGRGVDFVLNFLTGDLLGESWRLLADNGTLLEIGKKDIVARNTLSMEPFDRNCSYRGIDISKPSVLDDLPVVEKVLQTIRSLLVAGHIKPISPRTVFPFDKILDAIRYMRSGNHMGKIVISHGTDGDDTVVPTRLAPTTLRFDPKATYLIIGGLKGLCGSLAVYMARCGVKSLTVMCRSGAEDDRSQHVIEDVHSLGAKVRVFIGDVSKLSDVQRLFESSELPIRGVIQGAMVLRDKILETMTLQEWHEALACKLAGTWNVHQAAKEQENGARKKLDFFTMLSSISGVVGTASQANYAAGNAFQDAFALHRHSLGLAAHSVNLGVIEDVGYLSQDETLSNRLKSRSGLSSIGENQLHEILKMSILQQITGGVRAASKGGRGPAQMITGLPFPLPEDSPLLGDVRFHSLLAPRAEDSAQEIATESAKDSESDAVRAFHAMLRASLPADRLLPEAIKLINKHMVRSLGLAGDVEASKPLNSYGIDSLAAVDLRNWVKTRLGAELTTLDVLNAASLRALCTKVVERALEAAQTSK